MTAAIITDRLLIIVGLRRVLGPQIKYCLMQFYTPCITPRQNRSNTPSLMSAVRYHGKPWLHTVLLPFTGHHNIMIQKDEIDCLSNFRKE
jgi:hypothetical protein